MTTGESFQEVRDNLGTPDDTRNLVLIGPFKEKLVVDPGPTLVIEGDIGDAFILGHSTNGVLGVANGTDGTQITLGDGKKGSDVWVRVVNPNKTFKEYFRFNTFHESSVGTANWDVNNHRLAMDTNPSHMSARATFAETKWIFANIQNVITARVTCDETIWGSDVITYLLSADDGNTWEEVELNTTHTFTTTGQYLIMRVVFIGQGGPDTYIKNLRVKYTTP